MQSNEYTATERYSNQPVQRNSSITNQHKPEQEPKRDLQKIDRFFCQIEIPEGVEWQRFKCEEFSSSCLFEDCRDSTLALPPLPRARPTAAAMTKKTPSRRDKA